ncbi:MAG: hypothetical protein ABS81_06885 [Pseudonocardia sp. SCN 72-86]|nr:MAG: hypothetical protein ABS81_06885 [Pseudonocardia sp. SCN 72-86]
MADAQGRVRADDRIRVDLPDTEVPSGREVARVGADARPGAGADRGDGAQRRRQDDLAGQIVTGATVPVGHLGQRRGFDDLTVAADALRRFLADRYARSAVVVTRAVERGEVAPGADPRAALVAATTAPVHHRALLLGAVPDAAAVRVYAETAAAGARGR